MSTAPVRSVLAFPGLHRTERAALTRADVPAPWHVTVVALGALAVVSLGLLDLQPYSPLWPVTGLAVAVAVLTRTGWGLLLALVGALAFLPVVGPAQALAGLVAAVPAVLVGVLGLRPGRRWVRVDDVPTLLHVISVVALAAPVLAAATGVATVAALGEPATLATWVEWTAADSVACLLIPVPMVIWWSQPDRGVGVGPRPVDRVLVLVAAALIVAGAAVSVLAGVVPSGFLLLLPVIWIALRWGARGVVLAAYLATAVAGLLTETGRGVFAATGAGDLARLWLTIAMVLLAGILAAVVARQRDAALAGLAAANAELAREAAEGARTLGTLMANLPGVAYRCRDDDDYTVLLVSDGAADLYGVDLTTVTMRLSGLAAPTHPDDLPGVRREVDAAVADDRPYLLEYRIVRPDGEVRWVWEQGRAVGADDDGTRVLEGFIYDVTERVTSQRLLVDEARVLDVAMGSGGVAEVLDRLADAARRHADGGDVAVLGLDVGGTVISVDGDPDGIGPAWGPAVGSPVAGTPVWEQALAGTSATAPGSIDGGVTFVAPVVDAEGRVVALLGLHAAGRPDPSATLAATHLARVGGAALSHVAAQERLRHEAVNDGLTGLPNRRALGEHVDQLLATGPRPRLGLLFLDVSGFRVVNETYGHTVGDNVLAALATRASAALPGEARMYRFSGDQFVVVARDDDPESMTRLARLVQRVASGPYRVGQQALHLTVTVGIAVSRPDTTTASDLVGEAASACDAARDTARDGVRVFDVGLRERSRRLLQTETGLRRALGTDEIETWFQPEYDLTTGAVIGAEALVRWRMPDGRLMPPDEFIPVAESAGLMGPLGLRVLAEACTQAAVWPPQEPPLMVSVNVAVSQLVDPLFPASVSDVLGYTGLEAERLCLEITESALADPDLALTQLTRLRSLGVLLAIDDFGTGYSSLSRLKGFPVDFLKIDRSFVSRVGMDADDTAIVDAVVALSRTLHLRTIAEGVETPQQAGELRARGVAMGQGYLWSRPVPADDLLQLLRSPRHGALRPRVAPVAGPS